MMRVALKFAYNGKNFSGYARQPGQRTIEQELLNVLIHHDLFQDPKKACFRTASRTDRGVSALGNVCVFDTTDYADKILNLLSRDISELFLYGISVVTSGFYPRHAKRREYRYYLRKHGLDFDKVLSAAELFTGEHNYQNFARVESLKNPIRVIDNILLEETPDFFIIDFFAQTFLWNQIRRIVSAVEKIGDGTLPLRDVKEALNHPEKRVDYQVAAPEPLLLKDVVYDFSFTYVKEYQKKLQNFEKSIVSCLS
jgi:tRNA pseudouridine38-40 synthase